MLINYDRILIIRNKYIIFSRNALMKALINQLIRPSPFF